jgi:hypothetical protein
MCLLTLEDKVYCACEGCKNAHAKCDEKRPCSRCIRKGIECVERVSKKRFVFYEILCNCFRKRNIIETARFYMKKIKQDHQQEKKNQESQDQLFEDFSLEPISFALDNLCTDEESNSGFILLSFQDYPTCTIMTPELRKKLGYSTTESVQLDNIFTSQDVIGLLGEIQVSLQERILLNLDHRLLKYCIESTSLSRKLLFRKSGEIFECIVRTVLSFSRVYPTKLESITMYIFWPRVNDVS